MTRGGRVAVSQYKVVYCNMRGGLAGLDWCHDTVECIVTGESWLG